MMKEMIAFSLIMTLGLGFLWGFSSTPSPYHVARQNYYQAQVEQSDTQAAKDVWVSLVAANPVATNCLGQTNHPPRPTRIAWMGASEQEVVEWTRRNEVACLDGFERQMRMIKNEAGLTAVSKARSSLG